VIGLKCAPTGYVRTLLPGSSCVLRREATVLASCHPFCCSDWFGFENITLVVKEYGLHDLSLLRYVLTWQGPTRLHICKQVASGGWSVLLGNQFSAFVARRRHAAPARFHFCDVSLSLHRNWGNELSEIETYIYIYDTEWISMENWNGHFDLETRSSCARSIIACPHLPQNLL
jgi:hypothetical protein